MSNYDFNPSLLRFNLRREGLTDEDYIENIKFRKKRESFEIFLDVRIGGLNLIKDPILNKYVPFYINIISYGKIGNKSINIHSFVSRQYDNPEKDYDDITVMVGKIYNDEELDGTYNFLDTSMYIEILITEKEIVTSDDALYFICQPIKNIILKTKIPYSDEFAKERN